MREDWLGLTVMIGFGLWLIVFPQVYVRFFAWMVKRYSYGGARVPNAMAIRVIGIVWLLAVIAFATKTDDSDDPSSPW